MQARGQEMAATFDLVVVGGTSLIGEAMLELLAESELPFGRLYVADSSDKAGRKVEFRERYLTVEAADGFDFGKVRLALFAGSERLADEHAPRAAAAGCAVVDTSARFRDSADTPLVVAEVNSDQLPARSAGAIVASPSPAALALAVALRPLQGATAIESVDATICYPASAAGRAGVEELARQAAHLLNARSVTPKVFPGQLAFNLLPQVGRALENGASTEEARVTAELGRLLRPAPAVNVSALQVPVFYGITALVHVRLAAELSVERARALLSQEPGITVADPAEGIGYPTPVTDAAHHDKVFVGRLRADGISSKGLNFCIVVDNVRKGAAINSIRLAELLMADRR